MKTQNTTKTTAPVAPKAATDKARADHLKAIRKDREEQIQRTRVASAAGYTLAAARAAAKGLVDAAQMAAEDDKVGAAKAKATAMVASTGLKACAGIARVGGTVDMAALNSAAVALEGEAYEAFTL